jgi:hypothetical protein
MHAQKTEQYPKFGNKLNILPISTDILKNLCGIVKKRCQIMAAPYPAYILKTGEFPR